MYSLVPSDRYDYMEGFSAEEYGDSNFGLDWSDLVGKLIDVGGVVGVETIRAKSGQSSMTQLPYIPPPTLPDPGLFGSTDITKYLLYGGIGLIGVLLIMKMMDKRNA